MRISLVMSIIVGLFFVYHYAFLPNPETDEAQVKNKPQSQSVSNNYNEVAIPKPPSLDKKVGGNPNTTKQNANGKENLTNTNFAQNNVDDEYNSLKQFVKTKTNPQNSQANYNSHGSNVGMDSEDLKNIRVFKDSKPSVVYINTIARALDLFSMQALKVKAGTGSGFIWDKDGHIVTNFHVVQRDNEFNVVMHDHTTWPAKLVGVAEDKDIAVLRISAPPEKLIPIKVGSSSNLQVGQTVYAIGNPFGLDHTLTKGIISSLGREIESVIGTPIYGVIQTDAAINPGNSGGPLLDSNGTIIGINTAIASPTGSYSGVGFAVPIDTVKRIVPQLIKYGYVKRVGLGIEDLDKSTAYDLGIRNGVVVKRVVKGSGADLAGIEPIRFTLNRGIVFDVITKINDQEVKNISDLYVHLTDREEGDKVSVDIERVYINPRGRKRSVKKFSRTIELTELN